MKINIKKQLIVFCLQLLFAVSAIVGNQIKLEIENAAIEKDSASGEDLVVVGLNDKIKLRISYDANDNDLKIDGINNFNILLHSSARRFSICNNVQSYVCIKEYDLKPINEGIFVLGPAKITIDGKEYSSNVKKIKITKSSTSSFNKSNDAKSYRGQEYFLVAQLSGQKFVLGEAILLTLKLYTQMFIDAADFPVSIPGFITTRLDSGQINISKEFVGPNLFNVFSVRYLLIPTSIGKKEIPPINVIFNLPELTFGFMSLGSARQLDVTSDSQTIFIDDVPKKDGKKVQFIGEIYKFNFSSDVDQGLVNEPINISMQIEGQGNFDYFEVPKIIFPQDCKLFDPVAKTEKNPQKDPTYAIKKIDYIFQVNKPGDIEIPKQAFIYFDTKSRSIKTIDIKPIKFSILPNQSSVASNQNHSIKEEPTNTDIKNDSLFKVEINDSTTKELPWLLIIILFLLPLGIFFKTELIYLLRRIKVVSRKIFGFEKPKLRFSRKLLEIKNKKHYRGLYSFFIELCASVFGCSINEINVERLQEILKNTSLEDNDKKKFLDYLQECIALSYTNEIPTDSYLEELFSTAEFWANTIINSKNSNNTQKALTI